MCEHQSPIGAGTRAIQYVQCGHIVSEFLLSQRVFSYLILKILTQFPTKLCNNYYNPVLFSDLITEIHIPFHMQTCFRTSRPKWLKLRSCTRVFSEHNCPKINSPNGQGQARTVPIYIANLGEYPFLYLHPQIKCLNPSINFNHVFFNSSRQEESCQFKITCPHYQQPSTGTHV